MTFIVVKRPQFIAAARLRETGDVRATLIVLRSGDPLEPGLREALAYWIAKGCKRKQGKGRLPRNPWTIPAGLAAEAGMGVTDKQRRAWKLFITFAALNRAPSTRSKRGRPTTLRTRAKNHVSKRLGVHNSTAGKWLSLFMKNPDFARAFKELSTP